jgi:hypothetical protein
MDEISNVVRVEPLRDKGFWPLTRVEVRRDVVVALLHRSLFFDEELVNKYVDMIGNEK